MFYLFILTFCLLQNSLNYHILLFCCCYCAHSKNTMLNSSTALQYTLLSRSMLKNIRFTNVANKHKKILNIFTTNTTNTRLSHKLVFSQSLNRGFSTSSSFHQGSDSLDVKPVKDAMLTKKMIKSVVAERGYFDTHAFVGALIQNGFTEQQAEIVCLLFKDVTNYISEDIKKECVTRPGQVRIS